MEDGEKETRSGKVRRQNDDFGSKTRGAPDACARRHYGAYNAERLLHFVLAHKCVQQV